MHDSNGSSASFFYKDGRKISVGECALFKPAEDSPPFVGIIRCLTSDKETNLKLRVNWLYRPAEVKLPRGVALEAALNEIFYSFHSDEIPAASLLHPCRVAFLRKGVELPPGVSSFVCRRVYDITNRCLWWLTDQDFIDERQQEVEKLLNKTCMEMRVAKEEHPGSRSPKPVNGSAATSPLKHSPDSVQNSSSYISSHKKGKKRERGEQSVEVVKRERTLRPDDGDSGQLRSENWLNSEIAKFCEKGGLVDSEAVMRLVRLMQPEKSAKKMDLTGRSMLVGIIAATDKLDCLNQFVQLKGLFVLNEWLQEAHKGKIGDSGNIKSSDKSVDDFLVVLLRALDKLPVNLNDLRMCNIGKSVNQLRTHKNSDIQKKARSLVDAWKKRVEAEMNINDTKSASSEAVPWPGRSHHENSHGGNRHPSGSDAAIRSSITHHSSLKSASVKLMPGESNSKVTSANAGSAKSALSPTSTTDKRDNCKDGQSKITANGGSSDLQPVAREEKSSSSSQSLTNSQCSTDQPKKLVSCGKEEIRRSIAGSRSLNKSVVNGSKHRKLANGPSAGVHREMALNRNSPVANHLAVEKESNNAVDAAVQESNNHKLIVKIPNRGRGLAHSITGGSLEDSSCINSRASSPALAEKHDQSDSSLRDHKHDSHQISEVDGPSNSVPQGTSETRKFPTITKIPCSPSSYEVKSRNAYDSSFISMNALIESCAKISEANVPISAGDDVGMNLLASVAASETSNSGIVSPALSPQKNYKLVENTSNHSGNQMKLPCDDALQDNGQPTESADTDSHINVAGVFKVDVECSKLCDTKTENLPQTSEVCCKNNRPSDTKVGTASPPVSVSHACTTGKNVVDVGVESINKKVDSEEEATIKPPVESQGLGCVDAENATDNQKQNVTSSASPTDNEDQADICRMSVKDSLHSLESCFKPEKKTNESGAAVSVSQGASCGGSGEGLEQAHEAKAGVKYNSNVLTTNRREVSNSCLATEEKVNDVSSKERTCVRQAESCTLPSTEAVDEKKDVKPCPKSNAVVEQIPAAVRAVESTTKNEKATVCTSIVNNLLPGQLNDFKTEDHDVNCVKLLDQGANLKVEQEKAPSPASLKLEDVLDSGVADLKPKFNEVDLGSKEATSGAASKINLPAPVVQDKERCSDAKISLASGEGEETEESPSADAISSAAGSSGLDGKLGIDLNEGFDVDDCKDNDPSGMTVPGCVSSVRLVSSLPSHSSVSASIGLPASITVAAAAKGAFVPPEELLRSKGELKWKGSAATSAFRPAEPRKCPEVSTSTQNAPMPEVGSGKQGRTFLEIDLNVADELVMEETSFQKMGLKSGERDECGANNGPTGSASGRYIGGLDLDLNRADETLELGQPPSQSLRFDSSLQQTNFSSPSARSNNDSSRRDFDLNNGPVADEVAMESSGFNQHGRLNIPPQPSVGFRINNAEMGNLNSWYPAGSSFSALPIPTSLPDREQPFPIVGTGGVPPRMLGSPTGTMPFNPDMYRGSVLSSSPAVPFPAAPFQYPVFPFGTNFPLPSSSLLGGSATFVDPSSGGRLCIPAVPSQLVGTAPNISSQYPRPYFVSLSDVNSSAAGDSAQKWGRQGLDLNAGPGGHDAEGRDATLAIAPRQVPNIGSLALADEQSRMLYPMGGGFLKRKEPDGGWDSERLNYKQHTWQ